MNCRDCVWKIEQSHTHHLSCKNHVAKVQVFQHGYDNGWATWPFDFDPIWIQFCSGYATVEAVQLAYEKAEDKEEYIQLLNTVGLKIKGINA